MYICHCRAVTDSAILQAIAGGARTIEELSRQCLAGSRCGGCWPALDELLERVDALIGGTPVSFPGPVLVGQSS